MISRVPFVLKLSIAEHKLLISKIPWNGKWRDPALGDIKIKIKNQLVAVQNSCAYCGLPFKGSKDKQIEHIAPKANYRQPQFTFSLYNLVLSCGYCNNLIVKGTKPTINLPIHRLYKKCDFSIVHPYFDNPQEHYDWADKGDEILIQIKNESSKAKRSIEIFGLDSEEMNELRAAQALLRKRKQEQAIGNTNETLIQRILNYIF
jgi:uncharacterized protein (TIGR02646 family)